MNVRAFLVADTAEGIATTTAQTNLLIPAASQKSGDRIEIVAVKSAYEATAFVSGLDEPSSWRSES